MTWYRENPKTDDRNARSIQVGLPADFDPTINRNGEVNQGVTVPEADR